eukprot:jgi/Chrpa1/27856/Chrysochromulina_OHIO_Genome00002086-RA
MNLVVPGTLDCDSRTLRICRLTLVDGAHWDDVSASLAHEHLDEVLPVPSFAAVIFSTSGKKAAKACIRCDVRVAQLHDDEPLGDDLPQLAIALVSWLRGALRRHGHVPLANGLLLDTYGLERATDRSPPSHQLQTAACIAVSGLNVEPSSDGHGGLSLQLSVRIEGRRLFSGTIGHAAQHLLTSAEQTTLRNRGHVELQHRLESEGGPAPPQCRLLPYLHKHSLLRLDTHLPPLPPADDAADDAAEDATDHAEPLAPRDAEGHRRLWGESHGLWLPATALGPFATVACAFGRTLIVPAACVWPAAPLRALRSNEEVPWAPCLQRFMCLIERQSLTALGKASMRFTQGAPGSGLPPSAEEEEGAAGGGPRGVGGRAAAAAAGGTGESAAASLSARVFTPSGIFTSAKALITSGGGSGARSSSGAVASLVPPPGLELLSTSLASRDAARALALAIDDADDVSAPRARVSYPAPLPTSSHVPALSPASRPLPGWCKGHGSSGRASGLAMTPLTATAAKRSKEPVFNPVASGDPSAAPTPAAGMAAWAAAAATAPEAAKEAAAKPPPPPPPSTTKPRPPAKSPPSAPAARTPPAWASKPPSTSAAPKEPSLPSATTSRPPLPVPSATTLKLPAPSATTPKLPAPSATTPKLPAPSATTPKLPAPSVTTPKLPAPSATTPKLPAPSATTPKLPAPSATTPKLPAPSALKKRRPAPEAMAEAASGHTSVGNPPPSKRRRVTFAPDVMGGEEHEEVAGKPTPPLLLQPPRSPRCTGKATALATALSLDLFGDGDDDNDDDAPPSPLSTPLPEAALEAAELFGAEAGCAEAFGRLEWPGEEPSEWLRDDGTLTRAACMLVEAAVRRYGRAQDGAMGHTELCSLNCAMGGADLDLEDFEHVCSFNGTDVTDAFADAAVTSQGFVRYMSQYLASDFDEARADLRKLGLVA